MYILIYGYRCRHILFIKIIYNVLTCRKKNYCDPASFHFYAFPNKFLMCKTDTRSKRNKKVPSSFSRQALFFFLWLGRHSCEFLGIFGHIKLGLYKKSQISAVIPRSSPYCWFIPVKETEIKTVLQAFSQSVRFYCRPLLSLWNILALNSK